MATPWEDEARNWIRWARRPDEVFACYAPLFFDDIVPAPAGRALEIGCGEGRVARQLRGRGHRLVAVDASATLAGSAREADALSAYLVADATALPFAGATFDLIVAYNSLQTMAGVDDMARAVAEAGRVLKPGGHFCLCVAHPMTDVGLFEELRAEGDLVMSGSYFGSRRVNETVTKGGLQMTFHGWTYTLEDYARALDVAGFLVELLHEPVPSAEQVRQHPGLAPWRRVPLFLFVRAVKRRSSDGCRAGLLPAGA